MIAPLVLALGLLQAPADSAPLVPLPVRLEWRTLTSEAARAGEREAVDVLRAVLAELGDAPAELARLGEAWEKSLASARPQRGANATLARQVKRELPTLVTALDELEGEPRLRLARAILRLDHTEPKANALLGRTGDEDGEWLTPEEQHWKAGARRVAALQQEARDLELDVLEEASRNPAMLALGGGHALTARGLELHSTLPPAALRRILISALRASAFARALAEGGDLQRPAARERTFLLLDSEARLDAVLQEAVEAGGLSPSGAEQIRRLDFRAFHDSRGWTVLRWRPEADFAAYLLWEAAPAWLGGEPQPCLSTGHLNSVALRFLGTTLPLIAWFEAGAAGASSERTRAARASGRDGRWRLAQRTLLGCRTWLVRAVRAGEDPPWARAMLDQEGKITDENLVKTTFVCEFLQADGRLGELLVRSRGRRYGPAVLEQALGEPLDAFEARWRRWLDPARERSLVAQLEQEPGEDASTDFAAALLALNQARANAHKGHTLEIPLVALEEELGFGAAAHARYLTLNPEQRMAWPGAHEEHTDRPGFSPEGALAGARALLAFDATPVEAVDSWLSTFYHRLPLLDPGLFGVGFGRAGDVFAADVRSLVAPVTRDYVALWPMPDALDVRRSFQPELPNPVPGSPMERLGQPVTVQLFFVNAREDVRLELELFRGETPVEGHLLAPDQPLFDALPHPNAWGFIPKQRLEPRTTYTAVARWLGHERRWSFTTGK